jgi:hypothetical protein
MGRVEVRVMQYWRDRAEEVLNATNKESLLGSVPMRVMQYWPEGKNCITSFVIKCGD